MLIGTILRTTYAIDFTTCMILELSIGKESDGYLQYDDLLLFFNTNNFLQFWDTVFILQHTDSHITH